MKVCVDAGHGQDNRKIGVYDPGAVGRSVHEADVALSYALSFKHFLSEMGIEVFMTRPTSLSSAPLRLRATAAEQAGCEYLVSFHLNAHTSHSARGCETLYWDDLAYAKRLHAALVESTGFRDRGVRRRDDLAILTFKGQAALLELGFITNAVERAWLLERENRAKVCKALASVFAPPKV